MMAGSKRGQDFLLMLTGLQKVAESAVKHNSAILEQTLKRNSSLKKLVNDLKIKDFAAVNPAGGGVDAELALKRTTLVFENAAILSQAMISTNLQDSITNLGYVKNNKNRVNSQNVNNSGLEEHPIYELKHGLTSLVNI
jgi:hypothetical protein